MNKTILLCTILTELVLGVLGFISMHLRNQSRRRKLQQLPSWPQMSFKFDVDYFQKADGDKGVIPPKFRLPRSRRV